MTAPSQRDSGAKADPASDPADRVDDSHPAPTVFGPLDVDPAALPGLSPDKLEITTTSAGATATVLVRGELLQETAPLFTDATSGLAGDATVEGVVVDLSAASFMDSTGLGTLVSLRNDMLVRGGRFVLVRPPDRVFRLFELTHLDSVFEFVDAA